MGKTPLSFGHLQKVVNLDPFAEVFIYRCIPVICVTLLLSKGNIKINHADNTFFSPELRGAISSDVGTIRL